MQIQARDIAYRKKIGKLGDIPVIEVGTKGGLHLVVIPKGSGVETLGAGPHKAVARHIAKKRKPDLVITELQKSEDVDVAAFRHQLPYFETYTDRLARAGLNLK